MIFSLTKKDRELDSNFLGMNLHVGIVVKGFTGTHCGSKADIHRAFLEISNAIGATPDTLFRDGMDGPISYMCPVTGQENIIWVRGDDFEVRILK